MNPPSAKQLWQEKLDLLQAEEAKAVDPAQKFKIAKDIEEAKAKLAELDDGGGPVRETIGRPEPRFPDDETRELSRTLKAAYRCRAELKAEGRDTTDVNETILDLRRRIREGGQLKEGDFLLDGRFQLLEMIGRGGFAQVWRAYDQASHDVVAIKVLHGQHTRTRAGASASSAAPVTWRGFSTRGSSGSSKRSARTGATSSSSWSLSVVAICGKR